MQEYTYEQQKNDISEEFEEYMNDWDFTPCQAAARVIEESARYIKGNECNKLATFVITALNSLKHGELPDFILGEIDRLKVNKELQSLDIELKKDINSLDSFIEQNEFKIVEFDEAFKQRLHSIL